MKLDCGKCHGVGLVKDPSLATLPELLQALNKLDVTRDWLAKLIENEQQKVDRWSLGPYLNAERIRAGKRAA